MGQTKLLAAGIAAGLVNILEKNIKKERKERIAAGSNYWVCLVRKNP